ncbi:TraB/GumN family protein [Hugenholtzia roseola]|uniref:TraB/GumN family protein n=1 Tax=Hugenholtzia roseola TaxID=1002 RepID=UPI00040F2BA3|nr:TraB/GumN family protein [Hugenholtzia roseola]
MTQKKTLLFALFFFCAFPLQAQLLWEITGKGLTKPSYLYGTMHVSDARAYTHIEKISPYLNTCEVLAGEMDLDIDPNASAAAMMPKMFIKGDTTLKALLDSAQYQEVKTALQAKMPMMVAMMDKIQPIFLVVFLSDAANAKKTASADSSSRPPLDLYLQRKAKEEGKEVIGLETLGEQLDAFTSISLQEQAKLLVESVEGLKNAQENGGKDPTIEKMLDWYAEENLDELQKIATQSSSLQLNENLLLKRNYLMAERIAPKIAEKTHFIAIGAAHLGGEEGVIALLKKEGFEVKPIQ